MMKRSNSVTALAFVLAAVYMVSYLTRINFGAVISDMVRATGFSKQLLSLSITGSFITYGIGQIVSGVLVDRLSPKRMITAGLVITMTMNLLLPLCGSPYFMVAVWCVNGFAQSMMWPPMVKIMTGMFAPEQYTRAAVIVSWGSSVGTILIYLMVPAVISWLNWKWVFVICAVIAGVTVAAWQLFPYRPAEVQPKAQTGKARLGVLFSPLLLCIMMAIVLQGMLRDGVTTWMPTFITEVYHWDQAASILTGVILPVLSIACFQLAAVLHHGVLRNPMTCALVFFGAGLVSAVGLYMATGNSAGASVALCAVLTGSMHGVNMMLISMVPSYFRSYGLTGTASGVLNSCTYVGSALSTYGVAAISAATGWKATMLFWVGAAALGLALCAVAVRPFRRRFL